MIDESNFADNLPNCEWYDLVIISYQAQQLCSEKPRDKPPDPHVTSEG